METNRLYIELSSSYYTNDLYSAYTSDFVNRFNGLEDLSVDEYADSLDSDDPNEIQYVIILKEPNKAIGTINLNKDSLRYNSESIQISYWINQDYAKQGYMKEALDACITYIFEHTKINHISARIFTDNIASQNLVKSLGFIHETTLKNVFINSNGQYLDENIFSLYKI